MKKLYEEQYKTCVFISRVIFYTISANIRSEEENQLHSKVFDIIAKNKLCSPKNDGFIGPRYGVRNLGILTKFAVSLGCTQFNPIYSIPGFYSAYNSNPKKVYQKWCKALKGQFSSKEIQLIEKSAFENGDNLREYVDQTWKDLKLQEQWTWRKELKHIISRIFL